MSLSSQITSLKLSEAYPLFVTAVEYKKDVIENQYHLEGTVNILFDLKDLGHVLELQESIKQILLFIAGVCIKPASHYPILSGDNAVGR